MMGLWHVIFKLFTDGVRVAASTGIDLLLLDDFKLVINDLTYHVRPPKRGESCFNKALLIREDLWEELSFSMSSLEGQTPNCLPTLHSGIVLAESSLEPGSACLQRLNSTQCLTYLTVPTITSFLIHFFSLNIFFLFYVCVCVCVFTFAHL
jgi:hypothetical protein